MTTSRHHLPKLAGLVIAGAALFGTAAPTLADSFYFRYGHAPPRWEHFHPRRHHYYAWGPPVVFVPPPAVVYGAPPPPPVVYAPAPGAPLSVTPTGQPYRTGDGRYCREYQSSAMVNGRLRPSYGMACLMPDGTWHIMN
jgi:hypothetical protein